MADGCPLPDDYEQHTVIAQIARAVFDDFDPAFYFVITMTGVILVLAANTAFNGFPVLGSILAKDGFLPRQLGSRGDRLAYSNGIVILAVMAMVLIVAFDAQVTRLIQLYIVGVFVSFTLSQLGMIRHWTTPPARPRPTRRAAPDDRGRGRSTPSASAMTAVVLVIVLVTKFLAGAWIAILAMGTFFMIMKSIRRHYDSVGEELEIHADDQVLPTRVHAIVLVSKVHKPTMRALAYAKASRPNVLEAVMVSTDPVERDRIVDEWDRRGIDVPLKILDSPYREIIRPIVEYAKAIREAQPRGVVAVFIPEYVVGRWWEQLLHNQTALRLKTRLLFTPGVMVTSVPYQLRSSQIGEERALRQDEQAKTGRAFTSWSEGMRRGARLSRRRAASDPRAVGGRRVEVAVGATAATSSRGSTTTAGDLGGTVVFVRHALPGERVTVRLTEGAVGRPVPARRRGRGARAVAGPGGRPVPVRRSGRAAAAATSSTSASRPSAAQGGRRRRAAAPARGIEREVVVEPVPGDDDGLRYRTRMRFHRAARRVASGCARTARASVRAGRRLPHRGARRAGARSRGSAPPLDGGRRARRAASVFEVDAATASGRSTAARPRPWSRPCSTARGVRPRRPGRRPLLPVSGSSPRSSPTPSAPGGRVVAVEGDRRGRRRTPRPTSQRPPVGGGAARSGGPGAPPRPGSGPPTSWSSTRRGRAPSAPVVEEVVALRPADRRARGLRPGGVRPRRRRSSPRRATSWGTCAPSTCSR